MPRPLMKVFKALRPGGRAPSAFRPEGRARRGAADPQAPAPRPSVLAPFLERDVAVLGEQVGYRLAEVVGLADAGGPGQAAKLVGELGGQADEHGLQAGRRGRYHLDVGSHVGCNLPLATFTYTLPPDTHLSKNTPLTNRCRSDPHRWALRSECPARSARSAGSALNSSAGVRRVTPAALPARLLSRAR